MTPDTAIIIRMHYPESSRKWEWRFHWFASMVYPRLVRQSLTPYSRKGLDVCVWCEPWHREQLERLGCKTFSIAPGWHSYIKPGYDDRKQHGIHIDFRPWESVVGLPRYPLQFAIDSDDLLLRDDVLHRVWRECRKRPDRTLHVSFRHALFDVETCQLFTDKNHTYSEDKGSAFYAIWQPTSVVPESDYVFIYDDSHQFMGQQMQDRVFVDMDDGAPHCAASVHRMNSSTRIGHSDEPIVVRRPSLGAVTKQDLWLESSSDGH